MFWPHSEAAWGVSPTRPGTLSEPLCFSWDSSDTPCNAPSAFDRRPFVSRRGRSPHQPQIEGECFGLATAWGGDEIRSVLGREPVSPLTRGCADSLSRPSGSPLFRGLPQLGHLQATPLGDSVGCSSVLIRESPSFIGGCREDDSSRHVGITVAGNPLPSLRGSSESTEWGGLSNKFWTRRRKADLHDGTVLPPGKRGRSGRSRRRPPGGPFDREGYRSSPPRRDTPWKQLGLRRLLKREWDHLRLWASTESERTPPRATPEGRYPLAGTGRRPTATSARGVSHLGGTRVPRLDLLGLFFFLTPVTFGTVSAPPPTSCWVSDGVGPGDLLHSSHPEVGGPDEGIRPRRWPCTIQVRAPLSLSPTPPKGEEKVCVGPARRRGGFPSDGPT